MQNDYPDIFEPFDRLIDIEICGRQTKVPENNTLLRCFQFLSIETISDGDFCWNGDCMNCTVYFDKEGKEKSALACRTKAADGMRITRMHEEIKLEFSD